MDGQTSGDPHVADPDLAAASGEAAVVDRSALGNGEIDPVQTLPPGSPLPHVPTATAATSMTSPAAFPVTRNEPENE